MYVCFYLTAINWPVGPMIAIALMILLTKFNTPITTMEYDLWHINLSSYETCFS